MTIEIQFASFFSMIVTGFYLGCMFDTNERIARAIKGHLIFNFICQFVFWLIQSMLIFYGLVRVNGGQVRLYFLIAIIFGYWLYFFLFRKIYQLILEKIIQLIRALFLTFLKIINLFLIKPVKFVFQAFLTVVNLVIMVVMKLFSFLLLILSWFFRPIFLIIPKNMRKYLVSLPQLYSKIKDIVGKRKQK
ncbi:MAG TPA: spore cortex biosynthesis protein YabQ [Bacilli bacterium]|nr:spore cortex biosynthesis protein YabQ [Bacilli bacterium]